MTWSATSAKPWSAAAGEDNAHFRPEEEFTSHKITLGAGLRLNSTRLIARCVLVYLYTLANSRRQPQTV